MTVAVNVAGRFLKAFVLLVLLTFVCKIPDVDVVGGFAAQLDSTVFTKEVESLLQILWINVGGAFDSSNCAVFKFDDCHADVLCFQIVMELLSGDTVNFVNLAAHHPAQQVDAVDTLVHQCAAILCPGASPFCLIVVVAVAVPANVDRTVRKLAEASCFQRFSHLLNRYIESVLMAGRNLDALFLAAADNLVCVRHAHRHRFFDDNIDAVVDAVQRNLSVNAAFGGDADQLRLLLFDHLFVVGIAVDGRIVVQLMLCQQIFHLLRHNIADCCKFQVIVEHRLDMVGCNSSTAN